MDALSAQTGPIFLAYRAEDRDPADPQTEKEAPAWRILLPRTASRHRIWKIASMT